MPVNVDERLPWSKAQRELLAIKPCAQQMSFGGEGLPVWPEA